MPSLASKIAAIPTKRTEPLWQGPCADGPNGGVTQSMLQRFLGCRERFRLKYVLGLEPADQWSKTFGYGNMWHVCEEAHADNQAHEPKLCYYTEQLLKQYPMQREEITKWYNVCCVQFPEYVKYWAEHPDVKNRTPLMQEQVFDVDYMLPSTRVVRLRGKFDSVDMIDNGVYLQENKTKGDIDELQVQRQLKFDLQTMMYLVALSEDRNPSDNSGPGFWEVVRDKTGLEVGPFMIKGVRYNVVRRPLSGGKGSIRPHAAKSTKNKMTPAETDSEFYERLRRDYIAAEPSYWFFRVRAEVSAKDIQVFRQQCLDPILEQLCSWYEYITESNPDGAYPLYGYALHWRFPFGVYNSLTEGGSTEYDAFFENGSEAGLRQVDKLFTEL